MKKQAGAPPYGSATTGTQTSGSGIDGQTIPAPAPGSATTGMSTNRNHDMRDNAGSADRSMDSNNATSSSDNAGSANRSMPNTAAGWLGMLLSGSVLSGAGVTLRRLRR
jgi:hypothetical protein